MNRLETLNQRIMASNWMALAEAYKEIASGDMLGGTRRLIDVVKAELARQEWWQGVQAALAALDSDAVL